MEHSKNNKYKLTNYINPNKLSFKSNNHQATTNCEKTESVQHNASSYNINNKNDKSNVYRLNHRSEIQVKTGNGLEHSIKASKNLDDLLKRCNDIGNSGSNHSNFTSTNVQKTNSSFHLSNLPQSSSTSNKSKVQMAQSRPLKISKPVEANTHLIASKIHTSKFRINKTITNNANVAASTSGPQTASRYVINKLSYKATSVPNNAKSLSNFDPKNYKINNKIISKQKSFEKKTLNRFKLIKNRSSLPVSSHLRPSLETTKLLALRRKRFLRTQNQLNIHKFKVTSPTKSITNRFKIQRVSNRTVNKSVNYRKSFNKDSNVYKLNNNYKLINSLNDKNMKYIRSSPSIAVSNYSSKKQFLASNLIQKSIMTINRHQTNNNKKLVIYKSSYVKDKSMVQHSKKLNKYCLFYNRFGRCARGEKCDSIHDPKRIALCPRFLRGTCKQKDCPFSHESSAEKTPLCSYFAKGCCSRENCPYSHIYCGKEAKICVDFALNGFCQLGSSCNNAHVSECIEFVKTKKCTKGGECPFFHRDKQNNKYSKSKEVKKKLSKVRATQRKVTEASPNTSANFGDSFIQFQASDSEAPQLDESLTEILSKKIEKTEVSQTKEIPQAQNIPDSVNNVVLKTRPSFALKKK